MVARYDYLKVLASKIDEKTIVVTNLGPTFEEWHSLRPCEANFYRVNLGLCTPVAVGLALALPHRKIIALDGDGNLLLNLGSLADMANLNPKNLVDIVLDNSVYQSGGGLPTATSGDTDLAAVARGAGVRKSVTVGDPEDFAVKVDEALKSEELCFMVAKIDLSRQKLPYRFTLDGREIKYRFVRYIENSENIKIIDPGKEARLYQKYG